MSDLLTLSNEELHAKIEQSQKVIAECEAILIKRKEDERNNELQLANEILKKYGLPLVPIKGTQPKKPASPSAPKYQNLANTSQTWTGKGAKPNWVKAHLEAGGKIEDLLIVKA